ncbi:MAG: DUF3341 domain-containing protein [Planctomycetota bacterium]
MAEPIKKTVGMAGLYDDADALMRAAAKIRDAGFSKWDCHTPYPVHGLDRAMGLKPTPVPFLTITAGFVGLLAAIALTGWLNIWQYPLNIGGKALFSWQAFVPIYFELFVLFAALATMGAIIRLCKLGRWHSPLHDSDIMKEVTSNRFAVVLEADDERYSEEKVRALLESTGCCDIRPLVEFDQEDDAIV